MIGGIYREEGQRQAGIISEIVLHVISHTLGEC
jgi:hypothetical protein